MLASTALIYLIGDRLFGRMSAVLGALLFAVCGIAVHLGAAATFDPMALFLLVLALYAAVRMRDGGVRWLLICPIALAAANLTKYATTAWDPVIIGTIVLYGWSKGRAQAVCLATSVAATVATLDFGILMLGGANLATGVLVNTIYPSPQSGPPSSAVSVLAHAALMIGLIVLIAIAGVWASVVKKMPGDGDGVPEPAGPGRTAGPDRPGADQRDDVARREHELRAAVRRARRPGTHWAPGASGSAGSGTGGRSSRRSPPWSPS